ncbi:PBP1_2 [Blepharisma stoltei]|uniref:LsmAD domain-containing protein n=1 Tax=Blepharisma stoltei TaxID=1481888 RepID=A0AAU9JDP5_9CILI|nr:unnamed protein product [Blepharisma stoltei]
MENTQENSSIDAKSKNSSNPEPNKSKPQPKEVLKQRLMFAVLSVLNKQCKVITKSGKSHQGRLHSYTSEGACLLDCKSEDGIMPKQKFLMSDILSLEFKGISVISYRKFKTDKEISRARTNKERELEKFECEGEEDMLEQNNTKGWNQFEFNEKNFGVKSTYDEKYYTTSLVSEHELTEEQIRRARKVEMELEGSKGDEALEDDEEAMFGAVRGSGRYKNEKKSKNKKNKQNAQEKSESQPAESQSPTQTSGGNLGQNSIVTGTPKDHYKQVRKELVQPKLEKYSNVGESVGSLNLILATPELPEEVKDEFSRFKRSKEKSISREEVAESFKDFSKKLDSKIRTWSRKNSEITETSKESIESTIALPLKPPSLIMGYLENWASSERDTEYARWS